MNDKTIRNQILSILPSSIGNVVDKAVGRMWNNVEEIRVYYPGSLWIKINNVIFNVSKNFELNITAVDSYITEKNILETIINNASKMTPNVFEYHLKKGYITIEGGHRIGFCGNVIVKNDEIITINQLNTISIRVSKNTTLFNKKVFIDLFTEKNPLIFLRCMVVFRSIAFKRHAPDYSYLLSDLTGLSLSSVTLSATGSE